MYNNKSFEEALNELEQITTTLEKGEITLDQSIDYFQKGIELSRFCAKKLDEIEKKISILVEDGEGNIVEKDMPEE